jgi:dienelactone hydrolase
MMRLPILLALAASLVFAQQYYEEDVKATVPIRNRSWHMMEKYIDSLPKKAAPSGATLAKKIGYPVPGIRAGVPRLEKIGTDSVATYYRCYIPMNDILELYGLYLIPNGEAKRRPLVIAQHGGGGTPELALFRNGSNYHDMIRGAAKEGYVVFAPLIIMYPFIDRDNKSEIPEQVRRDFDAALRERGTSLFGVETTMISEGLTALLKRPEVDAKRVAMVGLSYGGFYTLYQMALDKRIQTGVASCSFRDFDPAEWASKPMEGRPFDMPPAELVKLISPRHVQVQCGVNDKNLPIDSARAAAAKAKGAKGFDYAEFDGVHEWKGDIAWPYLRQQLGVR